MDKMLVDKIKIIRIYIQLDYLYDFFVRQKKTYIAIYILQKYIQTLHLYTAPNIVKHTHTYITLTEVKYTSTTREMFREMIEQLNINIKTAAAESPWSDELVKEKYGVAGNMLEKVISDVRCSLDVAFA